MKIPGLDDALAKLDKFDEMLPVLRSIDHNLRVLAEAQIMSAGFNHTVRTDFLNSLTTPEKESK